MTSLHDISGLARNWLFLANQMTFGELYYLSYHREIIRLALNYLTVNKFQEETDGEVNPPQQPLRPCLEGVTLEPWMGCGRQRAGWGPGALSPMDSHPWGAFRDVLTLSLYCTEREAGVPKGEVMYPRNHRTWNRIPGLLTPSLKLVPTHAATCRLGTGIAPSSEINPGSTT